MNTCTQSKQNAHRFSKNKQQQTLSICIYTRLWFGICQCWLRIIIIWLGCWIAVKVFVVLRPSFSRSSCFALSLLGALFSFAFDVYTHEWNTDSLTIHDVFDVYLEFFLSPSFFSFCVFGHLDLLCLVTNSLYLSLPLCVLVGIHIDSTNVPHSSLHIAHTFVFMCKSILLLFLFLLLLHHLHCFLLFFSLSLHEARNTAYTTMYNFPPQKIKMLRSLWFINSTQNRERRKKNNCMRCHVGAIFNCQTRIDALK